MSSKRAAEEPFVLTAMLSLVGASIWLQLRPRLLLMQFWYSAEMLALTHVVTLGFASSILQGVMQRLAPRSLGVRPPSRVAALMQCAIFLAGASGLVVHFAIERFSGLAWSAATLLVAAVWLAWNFRGLFAIARAGNWSARWVASSLLHFVLAAFLGASYAALRGGIGAEVWTAPLLDRLGAHLHIALLGWIGGAIFGYQLKLLPATRSSPRVEALRFVLVQAGLLGLTACFLAGGAGMRWFALAIGVGIALRSVPAIVRMGGNTPGLWETVAHGLLLALAVTGVALAFEWPALGSDLRPPLELAYGYVALFGWVLLTIMGTSWKLFSTWVWEERFLPERATKPVPPVHSLASKTLRDASGIGLTVGVVGAAASIVVHAPIALRFFLAIHFAGVLCFVANFLRIARWELMRRRPASGADS